MVYICRLFLPYYFSYVKRKIFPVGVLFGDKLVEKRGMAVYGHLPH